MFEKMGKSKAKREVQALRDLTIQSKRRIIRSGFEES
ncbi:MAG: hypothetical protein Ct9H300mP3_01680 [Gammaproteobacteria bacterium]|nr:MAG: hypothetical protein Ct9H300mP3_01680 [Gammaproteobacteria bacterium]